MNITHTTVEPQEVIDHIMALERSRLPSWLSEPGWYLATVDVKTLRSAHPEYRCWEVTKGCLLTSIVERYQHLIDAKQAVWNRITEEHDTIEPIIVIEDLNNELFVFDGMTRALSCVWRNIPTIKAYIHPINQYMIPCK